MQFPRRLSTTVAVAVLSVVTLGAAASFGAAGAGAQAAAAPEGWVRLGHFAPGSGKVDVLIDGTTAATGVTSGTVTPFVRVAAGTHRVEAVAEGAPDSPPIVSVETGVPAQGSVTVGVVTTQDGVGVQVYDGTDEMVPPGQALVRFIHTVPDIPAVDIAVVGGPTLASGVSYPDATPYVPVAPGTYDIEVRAAGTEQALVKVAAWSVAAGTEATVVVNRTSDDSLGVIPLLDAGGTTTMPVGGAATGMGGLATRSGGMQLAPTFTQVLVAAVASTSVTAIAAAASDAAATSPPSAVRSASNVPLVSGANVNVASPGDPTGIRIPSLAVASSLVPLGLAADGAVEVPATADQAGWFADGPRPGAAGAAVILGHVDSSDGPGVFADLHEVAVGAQVVVTTTTGDRTFVVNRTEQVPKDRFPTAAVYDTVPEPQLRLITCGGSFDRSTGHYRDNVVVYLTLAPGSA